MGFERRHRDRWGGPDHSGGLVPARRIASASLRFPASKLSMMKTVPMRAKNIGVLILVWIGTVAIAFLAGYVPQHSQLRHDEARIANLNLKMELAQLRTLAGTLPANQRTQLWAGSANVLAVFRSASKLHWPG